jgi:hypothetical protein
MRVFAGIAVLLAGTGTATAAWNNVAQPTCNNCQSRSSFFAPAPSNCCPTTCYQQRCYYQPYTAYRQETVLQPVTTYRTSYYWEPVTTYTYTSYYDPCTGCCQRVCTPCTSYQLRSQCNAVQSYVQRCQMVPYTAYRQSCYMEPVVYTPPPCPTPCPTPTPGISEPPISSDPNHKPRPGISEDKNLPPQNLPNNRNRALPGNNNAPLRTDRITSNTNGRLQGTVVADDRITPKGNARIFFANTTKKGEEFSVQADLTGRFSVELPAGDWTMYLNGNDGKAVFHSQITVRNSDQRLVTVVSR